MFECLCCGSSCENFNPWPLSVDIAATWSVEVVPCIPQLLSGCIFVEAAGIDARMLAGRELLRVKLESMESCDPKQVGRLLAAGVHAANMPQPEGAHPPSTQALETQLTVATHAAETQAGTGLSRVTCHRFTCSVQRLPSWTTTSTMNWPAMSACKSRHSLCHPFCCAVRRNIWSMHLVGGGRAAEVACRDCSVESCCCSFCCRVREGASWSHDPPCCQQTCAWCLKFGTGESFGQDGLPCSGQGNKGNAISSGMASCCL